MLSGLVPAFIGPTELVIILVLALIIFGPGKLPEVGKAIGRGLNEFKKAQREVTEEPPPAPKSSESTAQAKGSGDAS